MAKSKILISFKDEMAEVFYKKYFQSDTTLGEIIGLSKDLLWVCVYFPGLDKKNEVELFANPTENLIDVTMHFSFDNVSSKLEMCDENFDQVIHLIKKEIWGYEKAIQEIFEMDELAVIWGGPDGPQIKYGLGVVFYVDGDIDNLYVDWILNNSENIDSMSLGNLQSKYERMEKVIEEIRNNLEKKSTKS